MIKIEKIHTEEWNGNKYFYPASIEPVYINPLMIALVETSTTLRTTNPHDCNDPKYALLTDITVNTGSSKSRHIYTEMTPEEVVALC